MCRLAETRRRGATYAWQAIACFLRLHISPQMLTKPGVFLTSCQHQTSPLVRQTGVTSARPACSSALRRRRAFGGYAKIGPANSRSPANDNGCSVRHTPQEIPEEGTVVSRKRYAQRLEVSVGSRAFELLKDMRPTKLVLPRAPGLRACMCVACS